MREAPVVVCQIGAREHYALAAALNARGRLGALATDVWAPPPSLLGAAARGAGARGRRLAERHSGALAGARVLSPGLPELLRAAAAARRVAPGWPRIMAHNAWFGARTARALAAAGLLSPRTAVFAYSYGALEILRAARAAGAKTLLGQIDPGPAEDDLVAAVAERHAIPLAEHRPPAAYWARWREECALADRIVVNSAWSRTLLARAGIAPDKVAVVPLALPFPALPLPALAVSPLPTPLRAVPASFTTARPLEALFLGQVGVRKGVLELLEAMARLAAEPVRLTLVGPVEPALASRVRATANVAVVGPVPRGAAAGFYGRADLMVLPTHSDGFALTQLEAQAAGLPLLVSPFCGAVVEDGRSGLVLPAVTPAAIEAALRSILGDPARLLAMAAAAPSVAARFTPGRAGEAVLDLVDRLGSGCAATALRREGSAFSADDESP